MRRLVFRNTLLLRVGYTVSSADRTSSGIRLELDDHAVRLGFGRPQYDRSQRFRNRIRYRGRVGGNYAENDGVASEHGQPRLTAVGPPAQTRDASPEDEAKRGQEHGSDDRSPNGRVASLRVVHTAVCARTLETMNCLSLYRS